MASKIRQTFQQPQTTIAINANQASRIGVGQLDAVMGGKVPWIKIPTFYYDYRHLCLPLTDEECTDLFEGDIPIFNTSTLPNRFTNAAIGSGVNETFLALGAGVMAIGEGEAFSVLGARVPMPATQDNTPVIAGGEAALTDCYCGFVDLTSSATGSAHATFWWGGPTWRIIEKFFQSYRLVIRVIRRFEIVNESLFDVGMTPTPPEFVGASHSEIPSMPFIHATNNVIASKDGVNAFAPLTLSGTEGNFTCAPAPLAPVTYGHPRIAGLANRMYCFGVPILFLPGMTFDVFFQQAAAVCDPDICAMATVQEQTIGDRFTSTMSQANPAVDLDCASTFHFPGGSIDLGVIFKGFAMWPSAAVKYIQSYVMGGSAQSEIIRESSALSSWLQSAMRTHDHGNVGKSVLDSKPELMPK